MSTVPEIRIHSIGDSLTAGVADVYTNRRLRSWPYRMAAALGYAGVSASVTTDLAVSGAPAAEVYVDQFTRLELRPGDLVCLWVGANDTIRRSCSYANTHSAIAEMFARIEGARCIPLTMELPRISAILPGPARLMSRWDDFGAAVNELVGALSTSVGGVHAPWRTAPEMTGPDGAHLSAYGHQAYANWYAAAFLARWGLPSPTLPAAEPAASYAGARWLWYLRNGVPWLWRRQFDPPRLVPVVCAEDSYRRLDVVERSPAAGPGGEASRSGAAVGGE